MENEPKTVAERVLENVPDLVATYGRGRSLTRILADAKVNRSFFANARSGKGHGFSIMHLERVAAQMGLPVEAMILGKDKWEALQRLERIRRTLGPEQTELLEDLARIAARRQLPPPSDKED